MAYLQLLKGGPPRRYEMDEDRMLIGRSPDCQVTLETVAVSRHHAQIVRRGNSFLIEDRQSRNGTYVNGNRIAGPTSLAENDRIKVCDHLFTFHLSAEPEGSKTDFEVAVAEGASDSATIMSTLDASTGSGLLTEVRPEVKLEAVLEITRNLGRALRLEELLPRILDSLFKFFLQADRGFILFQDEETGRLIPKAIKSRRETGSDTARVSRTIVRQAMEKKQAILSADASSDSQFGMSQSVADLRIHSIMCVPLFNQQKEPVGIIQLHAEDRRQNFTQEDLDVLVSVASTAAVALENAQLHESLVAQERMDRELQFARQVQRGFLPSSWPQVRGYGFYAFYEAAYSVGGDYYGFIDLPEGRLVISLGDVSGKGMPAALLMARLSSDVRFSAITSKTPEQAVESINRSLADAGLQDQFVTFLYMLLDTEEHALSVVNAGHMPPVVRRSNGTVEEIGQSESGFPLNVSPDPNYKYHSVTVPLERGSTLLMYSDGVTESMNPAGELFGSERLLDLFGRGPADPALAGEAIIKNVRSFAAGRHQSDDITLISIGRYE